MQIHLIANAHLDPVWLWDWREGLNEGLTTVKTILNLMDESPELKFIRGEAVIYQHIEQTDPATFRRIQKMVEAGRWDIVGGTYLQPDTNLAGIETLARQFTRGQRYFQSRFGRCPTVAWQADSFGHSAGLPEVLASAGIDSFAFLRPDSKAFPIPEPAFWWEGQGGARILAYRPLAGWYGAERDELPRRLDALVEASGNSQLENIGCFYGLGNHGGGPSRRQLRDISQWAANHPKVEVVHSGLHEFFGALRRELQEKKATVLPVHRGELNFCLRGCYSSAAKLKSLYRHCEQTVSRAEKTDSVIAAKIGRTGADFSEPWDGVLFNSFHDILPGSSIERALEDQIRWMGGVVHSAQRLEFRALNELAALVDTTVKPVETDHPTGVATFVWNPHPHAFNGHVEVETCIDYRPLFDYKDRPFEVPMRVLSWSGKPLPFQEITTESNAMPYLPWRKRVLVPVSLPAFGWNVLETAWVEGAITPKVENPVLTGPNWIDNGIYRVETRVGNDGVHLFLEGKPVFGKKGLGAVVIEDPWGCWGGMLEEKESWNLTSIRERWKVIAVENLETGPERGKLWVRLAGAKSRIDLAFSLTRDREAVDVAARVMWDDRSARLKLEFPVNGEAEFEVPGAVISRNQKGELPGGRWVRIASKNGGFGFASDSLYNFSLDGGELQATVVRGTRYADETQLDQTQEPWRPTLDTGELNFRFLMAPGTADISKLANVLEQPPVSLLATPTGGHLPREGSLASLQPESLQLLALKSAEDGVGFVLRAQAPAGSYPQGQLTWMGQRIPLGRIAGGKILSWRLKLSESGWKALPTNTIESPEAKHQNTPCLGGGDPLPGDLSPVDPAGLSAEVNGNVFAETE